MSNQQQGRPPRDHTPLAVRFSEAPPAGLNEKQQAEWRLLWDRANALRTCFNEHPKRSTAYKAWQEAPAAPGRKRYKSVTAMSAQLSKATWDLRNLERIAIGIPPVIGGAQEVAPDLIAQALDYPSGPGASSQKPHDVQEEANNGIQQDAEPASGSGFKLALLSRKETKELLLRKEDRDYGVQSAERLCTKFPCTEGSDDGTIENESQAGGTMSKGAEETKKLLLRKEDSDCGVQSPDDNVAVENEAQAGGMAKSEGELGAGEDLLTVGVLESGPEGEGL